MGPNRITRASNEPPGRVPSQARQTRAPDGPCHQVRNGVLQDEQIFAHIENKSTDMESTMTFRQGVSGNPHGNRHRTRHLLNQEFMQALLLNFRHQGKKAIEKVARNQPAAYLKILALLVPREMRVEHSQGVKAMTDEQLEAAIEAIQAMLEQRPAIARRSLKGHRRLRHCRHLILSRTKSPGDRTRSWMQRTWRSRRRSASRESARCHHRRAGDLDVWQVGTSDYGGRHRSVRNQPSKPSDARLNRR